MAKSPKGPWITPAIDTFDGHAFYAAKSVSDGKRRILFGWNCIKNEEKDDAPWQWGGTIIPHELIQNPDGTLCVKCPEEIQSQYSHQLSLKEGYRQGAVCKTEDGYTVGRNDGMSIQMLGHMPQNCKISMAFTSMDEIGDFGLLLRGSENYNQFYKVKFERLFNRLTFDKLPRKDNKVHCQVDMERYCKLENGKSNTISVIAEGSVLEVYVNDTVAMSCRMFDLKDGDWGIYAHNTTVTFRDISICTEEEQ
jgi:beta-fructofuranosidase